MDDTIFRADAIDAVASYLYKVCLAFHDYLTWDESRECATSVLQSVPSATQPNTPNTLEALEALDERKHGEWRPIQIGKWHGLECTVCKVSRDVPCGNNGIPQWKYCPECGAKMMEDSV